MGYGINKVAVLGAGVMGQGIAAHLANAGVPSVLFDIVPRDGGDRRKLAKDGIKNATKLKPAAFFRKDLAGLITPANYEDDGALLSECDWIIEVVVENLNIKHKVYQWVAEHRREGSIVSSNTSGISLASMAEPMSDEMKGHFLVTHFFNPVRYMRLLELVSGDATLPEVTQAIATFGEEALGKGIVYGKDTPNFVANRVGCYGMTSVFRHMERLGLTVPQVDAIFGKPMGRPKSAVFRTADLVGLDTLDHVFGNVYDGCPDDEAREQFVSPDWLKRMISEGALGSKSGFGFYKKTKIDGKKAILARDLATGEYVPSEKARFDSIKKAREADTQAEQLAALVYGEDVAAQAAWSVTADTLIYAANRIPEIADDVVNVDRGMRWGFGWDLGPFENWDAIGVAKSVAKMEAEGLKVPSWVKDMLAAGRESFYARTADGTMTFWNQAKGEAEAVPSSERWLILNDVKASGSPIVDSNYSADLIDIGDGVLCLSFKSKMNALDDDNIGLYAKALDLLEADKFDALVIGNQGGNAFSAGANLMAIGWAAMGGEWDKIEAMVAGLQETLQRAKYCSKPVVTAPWGLTLGGGAEVAMQASACIAAGELYMGLVEVGVGLIPAGGGCKEVLSRYLGDIPRSVVFDPNPFVQEAFKGIAMATVATSAEEARNMLYLRPNDRLVLDPDALIHSAKQLALGMAQSYEAPKARSFILPGPSGRAAIEVFLNQMHDGGYATDHDVTVGRKLAHVLTGGNISTNQRVDEQHILDLEREAFLSLCGDENTQARIQHMLSTGKPLRN